MIQYSKTEWEKPFITKHTLITQFIVDYENANNFDSGLKCNCILYLNVDGKLLNVNTTLLK